MSDFQALLQDLEEINPNKILKDIFSDSTLQRWILEQPKKRIQTTGINSDGKRLQTDSASGGNPYSDATMDLYDSLGLQINHVDLTVLGDFWDSFRFILDNDGFEITGDFIKNGTHIGENFLSEYTRAEFYETITSLSDSELDQLLIMIYNKFNDKLNEILQN